MIARMTLWVLGRWEAHTDTRGTTMDGGVDFGLARDVCGLLTDKDLA